MFCLDHLITQARTIRNEDFQLLFFLLHIFVQQLIVRVQTSFTLSLAGLGCHTYPLELTFQSFATLAGSLFFHFHSFGLLLQPAGVVALPGNTLTTVKFKDPSGNMIEEVAVVRHCNYRTFVLLQMLLQPVDRLSIQVVRRFVEQQDIRLLQ